MVSTLSTSTGARFQIEVICRDPQSVPVLPQIMGYADKTATLVSAEVFCLAPVIHTLARGPIALSAVGQVVSNQAD